MTLLCTPNAAINRVTRFPRCRHCHTTFTFSHLLLRTEVSSTPAVAIYNPRLSPYVNSQVIKTPYLLDKAQDPAPRSKTRKQRRSSRLGRDKPSRRRRWGGSEVAESGPRGIIIHGRSKWIGQNVPHQSIHRDIVIREKERKKNHTGPVYDPMIASLLYPR